ncbi:TRM13 [Candida theae]|uniref:tRNA:m(4)X modification enzyme TRM13 n=1 Tax=Candida theae TaxID=1198502 RepID=A0AAD5BHZ5_9ASCO|nr:TRM13 [Candida theae]KAI5963880.1 TRM13 [Candida theae]
MTEGPELKKQKSDKPQLYQCEYVIPKKNKRCRMLRKKQNKFCSEHMIHDASSSQKRIPCPLNPNHTIWEKDLKSHLEKCNARPKKEHDLWYIENFNSQMANSVDVDFVDGPEQDDNYCREVLDKIEFEPLEKIVCQHDGLLSQLQEKTNQKHVIQQSSLIGNLKRLRLLSLDAFYMEFGCGKGELSRYVNQCVLRDFSKSAEGYGFGLIDRGTNRLKADNKIIQDSEPFQITPIVKRSKIDIKHLNLDKFLEDVNPTRVVAISKHLCGAATDLTLKSLLNSSLFEGKRFGGVLIAMCCRHVCFQDEFLPQSKQYLINLGFNTRQSMTTLTKMVSWGVNLDSDSTSEDNVDSGLTSKQRYEYGIKARRIIDESRVHALKMILGHDYNVEIFWYVDTDITKENVCLSITRHVNKDE